MMIIFKEMAASFEKVDKKDNGFFLVFYSDIAHSKLM